jgi:hypothetical protein
MFRRDFLAAVAAAAGGLMIPRRAAEAAAPRLIAATPTVSGSVIGAAVNDGSEELRRLLKQCRCVEIEGSFRVDGLVEYRTVHRAEDDPHGASLNDEFERRLATAKPRSVNYSMEAADIDVFHLGDYAPGPLTRAITTIEVEWIGGRE